MFAVELHFDDGMSPNEMIVVRRHTFIVGCSDDADVVVEGSAFAVPSIRVRRGHGRQFFAQKIGVSAPEKSFEREGRMQLGGVGLVIRPIDIDFILPPGESMDRAGLRVLRRAFSEESPSNPTLVVRGDDTFEVSLPKGEALLIGRSRSCAIRLTSPTILSEHALVRVRDSGEVSLEPVAAEADIVSADGEKVSGAIVLSPGVRYSLGRGAVEIELTGDTSESALNIVPPEPDAGVARFPCLVSKSDVMRPDRYPLTVGRKISIGRDPSNDVWLNVPHVSRVHAELVLREDGVVEVTDLSSNGTSLDGERLERDVPRKLPQSLSVLDFHRGITVAVCFNGREESEYFGEKRKARRSSSLHGQILSQIQIPTTPFNSDEEPLERPSWFVPEADEVRESSDVWSGKEGEEEPYPGPEPALEEMLPEARMGRAGRIAFYGAVGALLLVVYFQWAQLF